MENQENQNLKEECNIDLVDKFQADKDSLDNGWNNVCDEQMPIGIPLIIYYEFQHENPMQFGKYHSWINLKDNSKSEYWTDLNNEPIEEPFFWRESPTAPNQVLEGCSLFLEI